MEINWTQCHKDSAVPIQSCSEWKSTSGWIHFRRALFLLSKKYTHSIEWVCVCDSQASTIIYQQCINRLSLTLRSLFAVFSLLFFAPSLFEHSAIPNDASFFVFFSFISTCKTNWAIITMAHGNLTHNRNQWTIQMSKERQRFLKSMTHEKTMTKYKTPNTQIIIIVCGAINIQCTDKMRQLTRLVLLQRLCDCSYSVIQLLAIRTNHLWRDYPCDARFLQLFSFMFWALPLAMALVHHCAALLTHTNIIYLVSACDVFIFSSVHVCQICCTHWLFFLSQNHRSLQIWMFGRCDSILLSSKNVTESRSVDDYFPCELKIHLILAEILYNSITSSNWIQHLSPSGVFFFAPF